MSRSKRHKPARPGAVRLLADVPQFAPTPERVAKGDIHMEAVVEAAPGLAEAPRDWTGDGPGDFPRKVVMGYVRRDRSVDIRVRLWRFKDLAEPQIAAAERFERDWTRSRLEPSMTVNLAASGGGRPSRRAGGVADGADLAAAVLDARDRIQAARQAVRSAGPECLRVFEAVVIDGSTSQLAGLPRYRDLEKASVHVASTMLAALSLLAAHYQAREAGRGRPESNAA